MLDLIQIKKDILKDVYINDCLKYGTIKNTTDIDNNFYVYNTSLYDYQKLACKKMNDLEKQIDPNFKTTLGILGNKSGSGKSVSILAQIMHNTFLSPKPSCKKNILNKVWIYENAKNDYIKTNLIVVPHYLINQWDNYLQFYKAYCICSCSIYNLGPRGIKKI